MYNKNAKHNREEFIKNIDKHIAEYKSGKPIKILAKENDVSQEFVSSTFVELGIKNMGRRTYSLNEHYFDEIDTQSKAYYLGFLFADGCNNRQRYAIHLTLQEDDFEILKTFSYDIGSNRPLKRIIKGDSYIYGRLIKAENIKPQISLELSSKHLSETLNRHGMVQNKSLLLKFPTIPRELYSHFIRGYFDGDGSFYTFNDHESIRCGFKIISTYSFCNSIKKIFEEELGIKLSLSIAHPDSNDITCVISTLSKSNVKKIMDWLYFDAERFLKRKHDKYYAFLENNK